MRNQPALRNKEQATGNRQQAIHRGTGKRLTVVFVVMFVLAAFACSSKSSQPGTSQPGSEPVATGDPSGSTTEPKPEPVTPDPAKPEPVTPEPTKPDPTTKPEPTKTEPTKPGSTKSGPKLHETCGANDECGEGACVKYYGIAGARGPEFKTCEIRCDKKTKCPAGTSCGVIADGPGQVCR
jgi:type IV secretory pathway VirB10-like protein